MFTMFLDIYFLIYVVYLSTVYRMYTVLIFSISIPGHGSFPSDSMNKPISGPRMPDGTRGFTMGRGRSPPLEKAEKAEE